MKRLWITAAAIAAVFAVQLVSAGMHGEMPPADGERLWDYITEENPYKDWEPFPGYEEMYEGKSPHGDYLRLYANDIAVKAAKQGEPMPDRAILVKENYAEDRQTLMAVTPMYRIQGYNPQAGDWFWVKYGPDGKIAAEGKVEGCIKCHTVKKDQDYIFSQPR